MTASNILHRFSEFHKLTAIDFANDGTPSYENKISINFFSWSCRFLIKSVDSSKALRPAAFTGVYLVNIITT